ncbi:hypothetical protein [Phenylobacterium sp.]|uniref:hypothetical protein n=1 Tax=Phenylobacterium sp. TaxID=1871053 RepID=UPI002FC6553D
MSFNEAQEMRDWKPAGPVAWAYGHSQAKVAVCVGPTGGGKSTESFRRIIRIAQWQHPSPRDGIRKARICVVAPTYRKIWDQVLPSYKKVIDPNWGDGLKGGKGDPADHHFDFEMQGVGRCHVEVMFRAVGETDLEEFYRGLEVTAFHYPEMDTHESGDILSLGSNRAGRYPEPDDRPDSELGYPEAYNGVYGDANAPTIGHWFHKRFYLERRAGDRLFEQPPGYDPQSPDGFHPKAENVANLKKISRTYYTGKAAEHEEWDVKRLLENKPGYSRHGKPVHPRFSSELMMAHQTLEPDRGAELVIGVDAGSNTLMHAGVFLQRTWGGQTRLLAEVVPDGQSDIVEFGKELRRVFDTQFKVKGVERARIVVDPAAAGQTAMRRGLTWAQVLQGVCEIEVQLAPSQDPAVRRTALDTVLKWQAGPGEPGFVVDPSCQKIVEALAGGYRFARKGDKISPTPDKNHHSHPAEALQYGVLGLAGMGEVAGGFIHGGAPGPQGESLPPAILQG